MLRVSTNVLPEVGDTQHVEKVLDSNFPGDEFCISAKISFQYPVYQGVCFPTVGNGNKD